MSEILHKGTAMKYAGTLTVLIHHHTYNIGMQATKPKELIQFRHMGFDLPCAKSLNSRGSMYRAAHRLKYVKSSLLQGSSHLSVDTGGDLCRLTVYYCWLKKFQQDWKFIHCQAIRAGSTVV